MARTGKKISDLLDLNPKELSKMSEHELRVIVSQMADAANKRVKTATKKGISSPAIASYERSGGKKFSTKGLDKKGLRREYKRAKQFLSSKTSTARGAKKYKENMLKQMDDEMVKQGVSDKERKEALQAFKSEMEEKKFWNAYNMLKEDHPEMFAKGSKIDSRAIQRALKRIQQRDRRKSSKSLIDIFNSENMGEMLYENAAEEEMWYEGRIETENMFHYDTESDEDDSLPFD